MATPRKKYPRRFPRPATHQPAPAQATPGAIQQSEDNYRKSLYDDLWELFKRVWALENQVSGPGGSITNITSNDNSITITQVDNSTINIVNNGGGGGGGNSFFWALVLGQ